MNKYFQLLIVASLSVGLMFLYFHFKEVPQPVGEHTEATVAKEVAKIEKVDVQVKSIKVYKPAAKTKLNLPKHLIGDQAEQVVASSKVRGDERPHTVTTLVNTTTGEFSTLDRVDPYPWVQPKTTSEIGVFYGYKNGQRVGRVEGKQEFLQVKALHLGVVGTLDTDSTSYVGIGGWVRW